MTPNNRTRGRGYGRFPKGVCGNPRGRPRGSLSVSTKLLRELTAICAEQGLIAAAMRVAEIAKADGRKAAQLRELAARYARRLEKERARAA